MLVTGPTGSGKSTTLASLIDIVNREKAVHIMTVEDPIEFLHQHKRAVVNQREVGEDTQSFAEALRHVLRQDPDVILVGEMRDLETISDRADRGRDRSPRVRDAAHPGRAAVDRPHHRRVPGAPAAADAGAARRVAPGDLHPAAAARRPTAPGRALAAEVLVATPAVRNLIREGKIYQIYSLMQAGAKFGMVTMDQHLAQLVRQQRITLESRARTVRERGRPPPARAERRNGWAA